MQSTKSAIVACLLAAALVVPSVTLMIFHTEKRQPSNPTIYHCEQTETCAAYLNHLRIHGFLDAPEQTSSIASFEWIDGSEGLHAD